MRKSFLNKEIIFTIGYTCFDMKDFIKQLKLYKITCIIDVRSIPKSTYYTDFNIETLPGILAENNILYRHYANEFGARQDNHELYPNGYLDFELFAMTAPFKRGLKRIANGLKQGQRFCLMCAEKDPYNCHRCILVSRKLRDEGYEIRHIVGHEKYITQEQIDIRLLDNYFPMREQTSLFSDENLTAEEYLNEAYKKRNKEIGYKIEGE